MTQKQDWKSNLWDAFRENIIVQSLLTLMFGGVLCVMWLVDAFRPDLDVKIPSELYTLNGLILGFWFKTKDAMLERKRIQAAMASNDPQRPS